MKKPTKAIEKTYNWDDFFPAEHSHHVFRSKFNKGKGSFYHAQNFYDLAFVEDGKGTHEINGHRYKISKGDVLIITPKDAHKVTASSKNELFITNIGMKPSVVTHAKRRYPNQFSWFQIDDISKAAFHLDEERLAAVHDAIETLALEPREPAAIDRFILNLTPLIPLRFQETKIAPDWLVNAMEIFREERPLPEGVDALVRISGKTPAHVSRSMKRFYEQTPTDFVNDIRLQSVSHQLLMTTKSVEEIAYDCGFNNLPHFFKLFRQTFTVSPLQFRRGQQQGTPNQ
ncbi:MULTISPECIES: AraC family transcriptional regulator [unclassified Lentimonas]|uniref:helix-turn-helix domain-containing protein n=1 Tax=unclassified Lentimonas TaxID=2630993 RepID=UPI0013260383|nr:MULTISPECIES: helix-turn-helix domain-containing protein [unclassified Lentimonas]CAA6679270.1 Unannotated [Lentimonas sp. CC4]CAA6686304.1 Unannotated [Lentimonas sp. CC6]CAA6695214.1 Unannotated [Lentimonas sp. CC19]CAA6697310.1 Unannotated [Lentimonas sp. CC10]CAA7070416.1 Unannotated [Lentimonas sp. CC11]